MIRADYIEATRALGEEPPASWTVPELKTRLAELKDDPAGEEELHPLQSDGGGDESGIQEEVRPSGMRQPEVGHQCHGKPVHPDSPEGVRAQDLHDHSANGHGPSQLWTPCGVDLRGGASDSPVTSTG